jgi:putative transposase
MAALGPKPRMGPTPGHKMFRYLFRRAEPAVVGRTLPTSRSDAVSIWSRSWTGRTGRCWRGSCSIQYTPLSPSPRSRRRSRAFADRNSTTPTRAASSLVSFIAKVMAAGLRISMDGRGRCMDNVFITFACPDAHSRRSKATSYRQLDLVKLGNRRAENPMNRATEVATNGSTSTSA